MNPIVAFFLILFVASLLDLISIEWWQVGFGFAILVVVAMIGDVPEDK